jgi:hypothetical protein
MGTLLAINADNLIESRNVAAAVKKTRKLWEFR